MSLFIGLPPYHLLLHVIPLYRCTITYMTNPLKAQFYFIFPISNNAAESMLVPLSL